MMPSFPSNAGLSRFLPVAVLAVAGAVLGACANTNPFVRSGLPCPAVNLLADTDRLVLFADGPGRDLTDVRFEVEIDGYTVTCDHDIDNDTRTGLLEVEIETGFEVRRGPAAGEQNNVTISYFLILRDAFDGAPIDKHVFEKNVKIRNADDRVKVFAKPVGLDVPLFADRTGRDFSVLLGLQMTREQIDFNRARKNYNGPENAVH